MIRMSLSLPCAKVGGWSRERWWCISRSAPRPCGERSIPQPLTPSSPFADATYNGGHMECIDRKLFSHRS